MQQLVLVIIIIIAVGAYLFWRSRMPTAARGGEQSSPKTVSNLESGDAVAFWDGQNCMVESVLDCVEEVGARTSRWQWVILSDGRLLEIAADGSTAFGPAEVLYQGSAPFEQLTGDQGVLKAFEQRVRDGVAGSQPVHFQHGRANLQVKSTGTFTASVRGKPLTQEVITDISPKAGDNVYFEMESASGAAALGIWTTHIALYLGQPLKESDIVNIFPKGKEKGS